MKGPRVVPGVFVCLDDEFKQSPSLMLPILEGCWEERSELICTAHVAGPLSKMSGELPNV